VAKFWMKNGTLQILGDSNGNPLSSGVCPCKTVCDLCDSLPETLCVYFDPPVCGLLNDHNAAYVGQALQLRLMQGCYCVWGGYFDPECYDGFPWGHGGSIGTGSCPEGYIGGFINTTTIEGLDCFEIDCAMADGWLFRTDEIVINGATTRIVAVPGPCPDDGLGEGNQLCCPDATMPSRVSITLSSESSYNCFGTLVNTVGDGGPASCHQYQWTEGFGMFCAPDTLYFRLQCCGSLGWKLKGSIDLSTWYTVDPTSMTCDPLSLVFDLSSIPWGSGVTATITLPP
jgi:hypothetical protein